MRPMTAMQDLSVSGAGRRPAGSSISGLEHTYESSEKTALKRSEYLAMPVGSLLMPCALKWSQKTG